MSILTKSIIGSVKALFIIGVCLSLGYIKLLTYLVRKILIVLFPNPLKRNGNNFLGQKIFPQNCDTNNNFAQNSEKNAQNRDKLNQNCHRNNSKFKRNRHYDAELICVPEFANTTLDDLEVIATLGVGGFGRVELVHLAKDKKRTFALKCLKKKHIVETQQQEHVFSEKRIMMACNHMYIAK